MPLQLAIPAALAAFIGGAALLSAQENAPASGVITPAKLKVIEGRERLSGVMPIKQVKLILPGALDRELPAQAIGADLIYSQTKSKSKRLALNNLHHSGRWFKFASYGKDWQRKLDKLFFYSSPPGVNHVRSTSREFNLAWMAQAPAANYPKFGPKGRSVRMGALAKYIGPKADLKDLGGSYVDILKQIPALFKVIGQAVTLRWGKAAKNMVEVGKDSYKAVGGAVKGAAKRRMAAGTAVEMLGFVYLQRLKEANPHAVKNGRLDISSSYMKNPKTYGDLSRPGKARPLLFNPPRLKE